MLYIYKVSEFKTEKKKSVLIAETSVYAVVVVDITDCYTSIHFVCTSMRMTHILPMNIQ